MPRTRRDLEERLQTLEQSVRGGEPSAVDKQHAEGKLTARERIEALLDPGSFVEDFMLAESQATEFGMDKRRRPTDGVVVGSGTIDGRPVYVFAQDWGILAGTVGAAHGEKIAYAIQTALKLRVPVIGLWDSAGARIQEGLEVTKAIGKIFCSHSLASGAIPQVSAIMGPCIGVGSYAPALTDVLLMVKGTSQMFITGPAVIKQVTGEEVTMEQIGGSRLHGEVSGCADVVANDDRACLAEIRRLLGFLPSAFGEPGPRVPTDDDPDRRVDELDTLVPDDMRKPYNVVKVIGQLVDDGEFFELKPRWARSLAVGFGRLDGRSVGFVANQPMFLAGSIDVDASDKAARFIRLCDAFDIPIVTLVDVPGFLPGYKQEAAGIIRHGAKMLYAYSEASVPKITVYLRKGYGGAKQAMCTREMGADLVLLWPGVELGVMGAEGAVEVLYRREIESSADPAATRREKIEEFTERFSGPFDALARQYAQAAIRPAETRRRLIQALRLHERKQEDRPRKKHDVMPV
jgi:acetyl-CoA carboxylase carboxyltransferase component